MALVPVRKGIYLEDNPPVRSQFRTGRRDPLKLVQVGHTAESGIDLTGSDTKAEGVANFVRYRTDAGSYHLVGDRDSIIQLIDFANEAFHDRTGSNRWAISWSLAMDADEWPNLSPEHAGEYLGTAVQMACIGAIYTKQYAHLRAAPAADFLTKAESDRDGASGFISHARRDPGRRTDPGAGFPWQEFFTRYAVAMGGWITDGRLDVDRSPVWLDPNAGPDDDEYADDVMAAQRALQGRGRYLGHKVDGVFGPGSRRAVVALCAADRIIRVAEAALGAAVTEADTTASRIEAGE